MKILKQSWSEEEIERMKKVTKTFYCSRCGCVFEADLGEYTTHMVITKMYVCECPNCGFTAREQED